MSHLNYIQFTSRFTAMLQSCNISNNNKNTFVHFLFQMSQVIFRVLPTIQLKMRALNTDPNHSTNKICTLSHNEYGCCYIGKYNYFESRLWWSTKNDQQIKLSLGGCCISFTFCKQRTCSKKVQIKIPQFPLFWATELKFWIVVVVVVFL